MSATGARKLSAVNVTFLRRVANAERVVVPPARLEKLATIVESITVRNAVSYNRVTVAMIQGCVTTVEKMAMNSRASYAKGVRVVEYAMHVTQATVSAVRTLLQALVYANRLVPTMIAVKVLGL